jgi:hypothetical protein
MRAPRSTAHFLSYDVRPAKQSERRIILDLLKVGGDAGLPISDYRYVGMGANRFYDFLLIHKYLGIRNMVSLEHDPSMFKRAQFNVPYSFIEVRNEAASVFLGSDTSEDPSITWFDYDGGIGPRMTADISSLATKLKIGDFAFVTSYGGPPRLIEAFSSADRLAWLQDHMGPVAGVLSRDDCEEATFPRAVHKMLVASFQHAFATRRDGKFHLLLQVEYSDTTPMITVGGALLSEGQAVDMKKKLKKVVPFLSATPGDLYTIRSLHLTERERTLFDIAATRKQKRCREANVLRDLGFKDKEIESYRDLLRYLPRYVETIV